MWLLEIPESSTLQLVRKARYIAPGSSIRLGRSEANDVVLNGAKSVSKQHIIIHIDALDDKECQDVRFRSALRIEDQGSKFGTFISENGKETKLESVYTLQEESCHIRLGKQSDLFHLRWYSIVFVLSGVKSRDIIKQCSELDIRYSKEYVDDCTHVLTTKLRTPKVLHGLLQAKWIVHERFLQALAGSKDDLQRDFSLLPDASRIEYLPECETELEDKIEAFLPQVQRCRLFSGITFIFFETSQEQLLRSAIEAGSGQVSLYSGDDSSNSILAHLKDCRRPVLIMPRETYQIQIIEQISELAQISRITQADLLDVILSSGSHPIFDAKALHIESLSADHFDDSASAQPIETASIIDAPSQPRRAATRHKYSVMSMDNDIFGDDYVPEAAFRSASVLKTPKKPAKRKLEDLQIVSQTSTKARSNADFITSHDNDLQVFTQPAPANPDIERSVQTPAVKKARAREPSPEVQEDFEVAPAATAFAKAKPKTTLQQSRSIPVEGDNGVLISSAADVRQPRVNRPRHELTEEEISRTLQRNKARAEAQSQTFSKDDDEDDKDLRNLGSVEFFHVSLAGLGAARPDYTRSNANSTWEGRKNFKGFRRRQQISADNIVEQPRVMIRLVESRPNDRAYVDKEWLDTSVVRETTSQNKGSSRQDRAARHDIKHGHRSSRASITNNQSNSQRPQGRGLFLDDDSDSDDDPARFRM